MPRWLWIVLFALIAGLAWSGRPGRVVIPASAAGGLGTCPLPNQFIDAAQPLQSELPPGMQAFNRGTSRLSPQAGLSLQARVLSRENYSLGRESRYSPTDLALGWGPMAEPGMAQRLHVSQGGRWYRYRWDADGPPLPVGTIVRNSANMHMVPFDAAVARALDRVEEGDVVRIHGWLVNIDDEGGWYWRSSLRRDDAGSGACELVLVCAIEK